LQFINNLSLHGENPMDNNHFESFDILDNGQNPEHFGILQIDTDGDGISDYNAFGMDTDLDGKEDSWLIDSPDVVASGIDIDGDGNPDEFLIGTDTDGDGIPDDFQEYQPIDENGHFGVVNEALKDDNLHAQMGENSNDPSLMPVNELHKTEGWHMQKYEDCGIVAQEFVLDEIGKEYGIDFDEDALFQEAYSKGYCSANGGTPLDCLGKLLEDKGIEVERQQGGTLEDINQQLQQGHHVIVALDSDEIWYPDNADDDNRLDDSYGIPGQDANHAVKVIGIDNSDSNNPMVILNDSGTPNGQGSKIPAKDFLNAWEDSNNYMVSTTGNFVAPNQTQVAVNNDQNMVGVMVNSVAEGNSQKYEADGYQSDVDRYQYQADQYAKDGNVDRALEFERKAAETQEKANEHYEKARKEYQTP
jgi:hypothetical protein